MFGVWSVFFFKNKGKGEFQKGNVILHCHTNTTLTAVYKVHHPICQKTTLAEFVLNSPMSAV